MCCCVSVVPVLSLQERGALGFERHYHVTDPFIRRLGLEAELQVSVREEQLLAVPLAAGECQGKSSSLLCPWLQVSVNFSVPGGKYWFLDPQTALEAGVAQ